MYSKAFNDECVHGMMSLLDECIDLVVTSPPYDAIRDYKGFTFDYKETFVQLYRIVIQGGVVVWIVSDQTAGGSETGTSFKQALFAKECGFNLHDTMIWRKDSCAFPEANRYYQVFEYMFVFSKGTPKTVHLIKDKANKWGGARVHGTFRLPDGSTKNRGNTWSEVICQEYGVRYNVWDIPAEHNNTTGHPAVFPQKLVRDHIESWSNEGDVVLDPFLGSGTTRIVAYDMNRNFIGYEISKEYFDNEEKRFEEHTSQLSFFSETVSEELQGGNNNAE